jgi:hypothetical protein
VASHQNRPLSQLVNPGQQWSYLVMLYFILKAALSGLLIALVSTIARRSPAFGALVASLPLVSVLGMLWLWHETHDKTRMEAHVGATFWYVLPSLPMFLLIPGLMRIGIGFYPALIAGCALTILMYLLMTWVGPKIGLRF